MSLIDVPGDELMRVHDLLQRTKDMMDSGPTAAMGGLVDSLGQPDLEGAARHFEKRWADGRYVLGRDLVGVRDAARSVAEAFQQTDDSTVAALTNPDQGGS
jgi:hypothetical protein